jgi:hypothetical protein
MAPVMPTGSGNCVALLSHCPANQNAKLDEYALCSGMVSPVVAILPEALMNGHLLAKGDPRRGLLEEAFAILDRAGFGIVQLPLDELPVDHARASLDFALDQIANYLKHGYRFLRIELYAPGNPPVWQPYLDHEIRRRAVAGIENFRLQLDEAELRALEDRTNAIRRSAMASLPAT